MNKPALVTIRKALADATQLLDKALPDIQTAIDDLADVPDRLMTEARQEQIDELQELLDNLEMARDYAGDAINSWVWTPGLNPGAEEIA